MAADWDHLQPFIAALVAAGNSSPDGGFRPSQGGAICAFELPLDREIVQRSIDGDERVTYDEAADTVHCSHCWAAIVGGDAVARSRRHHDSWSSWDRKTEAWTDHAVWDNDGWRYEP